MLALAAMDTNLIRDLLSPFLGTARLFLRRVYPYPGGRGICHHHAMGRALPLPAFPVLFLANQSGAATDEIWFIAIFAIGAVVGLLLLAFRFVGARQPPAAAAQDDPPARAHRYCTRCGERLRASGGRCSRCDSVRRLARSSRSVR